VPQPAGPFVRFSPDGHGNLLQEEEGGRVAVSHRKEQGLDSRAPREHSAHRARRVLRGQGVTPAVPTDSPHVQASRRDARHRERQREALHTTTARHERRMPDQRTVKPSSISRASSKAESRASSKAEGASRSRLAAV